jgi:transposase
MTMRKTSLHERLQILEMAAEGVGDGEIAQRLGWKERTVRKWRLRGRTGSREQLASAMGRPRTGAMGTFTPEQRDEVLEMRKENPGWGALTLRTEFELAHNLDSDMESNLETRVQHAVDGCKRIPSCATIGRLLRENGLTRRYERHGGVEEASAPAAEAPHDVWEMDARGHERIVGVGVEMLIHLNDRNSRAKLLSFPCHVGTERMQHRPAFEDYQLCLRLAFAEWGLPQAVCVDRDSVFMDNTSRSPFPSHLALWLTGLGVTLDIGPYHRPTDRGMTERSHQTWAHQVLDGQAFEDWDALWQRLEKRKHFLNYSLPCRTTQLLPPLIASPAASIRVRHYDPQHEPELFDVARIDRLLATGCWFRTASHAGIVSLGGHKYWLHTDWKHREVEIRFNPQDRHLHFTDASGAHHTRLPLRGVEHPDLCGSLRQFYELRPFQFSLFNEWPQPALTRLIECSAGTTI